MRYLKSNARGYPQRYSLPDNTFNGNASSSLAVAEFQGQAWDQADPQNLQAPVVLLILPWIILLMLHKVQL